MTRLRWLFKVTRPVQFIAAALTTWGVALLSNGSDHFTTPKIAAAISTGMGVLGASVFHYGAANKMYARKFWDLVDVKRPRLLVAVGTLLMAASAGVTWRLLPNECFWLVVFDAIAILLYSRILSKHWITKNVAIALVCTTPVLLGWFSGHHAHPALPYIGAVAFCAYFAREIVKDVHDVRANRGIRVTLPISIGVKGALRIAGVLMAGATISAFLLARTFPVGAAAIGLPLAVCLAAFGIVTSDLFTERVPRRAHQFITVGVCSLIVSGIFVGLGVH